MNKDFNYVVGPCSMELKKEFEKLLKEKMEVNKQASYIVHDIETWDEWPVVNRNHNQNENKELYMFIITIRKVVNTEEQPNNLLTSILENNSGNRIKIGDDHIVINEKRISYFKLGKKINNDNNESKENKENIQNVLYLSGFSSTYKSAEKIKNRIDEQIKINIKRTIFIKFKYIPDIEDKPYVTCNSCYDNKSIKNSNKGNKSHIFAWIFLDDDAEIKKMMENYHTTYKFDWEYENITRCEPMNFLDHASNKFKLNLAFKIYSISPLSSFTNFRTFLLILIQFLLLPAYLLLILIFVPLLNSCRCLKFKLKWYEGPLDRQKSIQLRIKENPLRMFYFLRKISFLDDSMNSNAVDTNYDETELIVQRENKKNEDANNDKKTPLLSKSKKLRLCSLFFPWVVNMLLTCCLLAVWAVAIAGPFLYGGRKITTNHPLTFGICYGPLIISVGLSFYFAYWTFRVPKGYQFFESCLLYHSLSIGTNKYITNDNNEIDSVDAYTSKIQEADISLYMYSLGQRKVPLIQLMKQFNMLTNKPIKLPITRCKNLFAHSQMYTMIIHIIVLVLIALSWILSLGLQHVWEKKNLQILGHTHEQEIYSGCAFIALIILFILVVWFFESMISKIQLSLYETRFIGRMLSLKYEGLNFFLEMNYKENIDSWQVMHHYLVRKGFLTFFNIEPMALLLLIFFSLSLSIFLFSMVWGVGADQSYNRLSNSNVLCWGILCLYCLLLTFFIIYAGSIYHSEADQMGKRLNRQDTINEAEINRKLESLTKYLGSTTIVPNLFGFRFDKFMRSAFIAALFGILPSMLKIGIDKYNSD